MYWLISCCVSALIVIYIFLDLSWRIWKRKMSFLPERPNVPWLGSLPYLLNKTSHELFQLRVEEMTKYNHLYVSWFMSNCILQVGKVEYVEAILKSQEFLMKSPEYNILNDWLKNGLLLAHGSKWKQRRQALTGALHFSILNNFAEIFDKYAIKTVEKLKMLSATGEAIEVQWLFSFAMLDVICETSMGVTINALDSFNSEYVDAIKDLKGLLIHKLINPIGDTRLFRYTSAGKRYYQCIDIIHNLTNKVIKDKTALREVENINQRNSKIGNEEELKTKRKKIFIDVLLDLYEKNEIDVDGIREEVNTFMFAGHDTTSASISWILYELGRHPDIQLRVQNEIDEANLTDLPLVEKIRLLKYTECVIKESLRLHCPVPELARKLHKDMVVGDRVIPKDTIVQIDTFCLHWNPEYWPEPLKFDPSRFNGNLKRNPYTFIPFSAGPRNCIGQKFALLELKVFIYHIMSNFDLESVQSFDELKMECDIITRSENGINIKFNKKTS